MNHVVYTVRIAIAIAREGYDCSALPKSPQGVCGEASAAAHLARLEERHAEGALPFSLPIQATRFLHTHDALRVQAQEGYTSHQAAR